MRDANLEFAKLTGRIIPDSEYRSQLKKAYSSQNNPVREIFSTRELILVALLVADSKNIRSEGIHKGQPNWDTVTTKLNLWRKEHGISRMLKPHNVMQFYHSNVTARS